MTGCTGCPSPPANASNACNGNNCQVKCTAGYTQCGNTACDTDTNTDDNNCGACGIACGKLDYGGFTQHCQNGVCGCGNGGSCDGTNSTCTSNDTCQCMGASNACNPGENCYMNSCHCSTNGGNNCSGGHSCCPGGCQMPPCH
jgi:hypothetical protein